ncbi:MAG: metallophosphoesterase [Myxococcota bacterium]
MSLHPAFGKKVALLPDQGRLIVATDLQGNLRDYRRLLEIFEQATAAGPATLVLTGDLVHGPSEDLAEEGAWPEHLGTPYRDQSAELILDFMEYAERAPAIALLGNHEHAHIGGPRVSKFHLDEAAVLDAALGDELPKVKAFLARFPLVATSRAGVVLTHGAPIATELDLDAFERLSYGGFEEASIQGMYARGTVGGLLWARGASEHQAEALLSAVGLGGPGAFVGFGHDVVREGYEITGRRQICFSTSYGLFDQDKVYLDLDLSRRYESALDLRPDLEIRKLWPSQGSQG